VKGFTITSLRTISRGEEVYDSYGRKCNSRFFVNYGFTLEENEDNEVVIRVALPKDDPHYSLKIRYLGGREASANREFQIPSNYKEKKTRELFSFLRFVHAREEEVLALPTDGLKNKKSDDDYEDREAVGPEVELGRSHFRQLFVYLLITCGCVSNFHTVSYHVQIDDIDPLSIRNELAVLRHLRISAEAVLAGFDDTLEWDLNYLKNNPRTEANANMRNCVTMRAGTIYVTKCACLILIEGVCFCLISGEKQVLHWFIDLAKNMTPLLQTPWKDLKKIAAKAVQGECCAMHPCLCLSPALVPRGLLAFRLMMI